MVNVGGDQAFYWNSEDDRETVCPDAYVIRGIDKSPRDSFKLWEERQKFPTLSIRFVLEIWSKGNPMSERFKKYDAYRFLDVAEYLEVDLLLNELLLHRKANSHYLTIEPNDKGRLFSQELNAELALEDGLLRLYRNGEKILTAFESQQKLAEMESLLAKERAEKERLQKELEQLKSKQP
jgi:Uma2 family endonuclease